MEYKLKVARPRFIDMTADSDRSRFDLVELKQDGMWAVLGIKAGDMRIYGPSGDWRKVFPTLGDNVSDIMILGEYMFGSNWAIKHSVSGQFRAFDIIEYADNNLRDSPLRERRAELEVFNLLHGQEWSWFQICPQWDISRTDYIWKNWVEDNDYEGVVFKNSNDAYGKNWGRIKRTFTVDYVCLGFNEGSGKYKGMAGSVKAGLYVDDELTQVCNVAGLVEIERQNFWQNQKDFIGKVFVATGYRLFASGALRHPSLSRREDTPWRDDKTPEQCVL
ncbi:hypothetical protein LCGC14_0466220 [marine sediment metagenome]|uniref:ATP-dependent DNA ligase family profile domain-containing protein n=1 Tax=marine sediment metagenome TaxID=412755 RepID=A0A0F9SWF6_9ZZZZ